jgi:hypothetical protein
MPAFSSFLLNRIIVHKGTLHLIGKNELKALKTKADEKWNNLNEEFTESHIRSCIKSLIIYKNFTSIKSHSLYYRGCSLPTFAVGFAQWLESTRFQYKFVLH